MYKVSSCYLVCGYYLYNEKQLCETFRLICTVWSDGQGFTLTSLLTTGTAATYCDVVFIACHETSQFVLCEITSGDVQKSPIRGVGSIGGNADEVEISTVFTAQCPAHSHIYIFIIKVRQVMAGNIDNMGT